MELGLYTFGDLVADPRTGRLPTARERMRQMIDMAIVADEAGLDIVGVGEHHGAGFVNSATAVTIAVMARATKQIRLTSAVTLLSTADPVRTFQEFATADLISDGRVELIFGRGAFTESFPLFGFDLKDYDIRRLLAQFCISALRHRHVRSERLLARNRRQRSAP